MQYLSHTLAYIWHRHLHTPYTQHCCPIGNDARCVELADWLQYLLIAAWEQVVK